MDAAEYNFSDTFEEQRDKLFVGVGEYIGANAENSDECKAENRFWVPAGARYSHLLANPKQPSIGHTVDNAMVAIERDNPRPKGVLPKDYVSPSLGDLIDTISLTRFNSAEGMSGGHFYISSCIVRGLPVQLFYSKQPVEVLAP